MYDDCLYNDCLWNMLNSKRLTQEMPNTEYA